MPLGRERLSTRIGGYADPLRELAGGLGAKLPTTTWLTSWPCTTPALRSDHPNEPQHGVPFATTRCSGSPADGELLASDWRPRPGSLASVGSQAKKAPVEITSARQLELLDEALAGSERGKEALVVANDRLRHASPDLVAVPAVPAKLSAPRGGRAAADRAVPTKRFIDGRRTLPRLSVSPGEAAEMLGVSRDYFDEHVLHELRIVRRGRRILIALAELERWLDRAATVRASIERRTRSTANA